MSEKITNPTPPEWDVREAKVSLFGAGINRASGRYPAMTGTLREVYDWMTSMRMMELTRQLRAITDEKEQKQFKVECLPFVTFSGVFQKRNAEGLLCHSGMQCYDIDNLANTEEVWRVRQLLQEDPHFETELLFTSPRGLGVKWVTHIDLARASHEKWYIAISNYLRQTYGLVVDSAPSNVVSACFLCFDANLIINPLIAPF